MSGATSQMRLQVNRRQRLNKRLEGGAFSRLYRSRHPDKKASERCVSARNAIEIDTANACKELAKKGELA
jgi:hypothetical protein